MDTSVIVGTAIAATMGWLVIRPMFGRISPERARQLVGEGAKLVDVRTRGEFASGHVDGALNIPLAEIGSAAEKLGREKPVVLYCHSGMRSSNAARILRKAGLDAHDLGPMSRWVG
jgi:phage shock protein E